MSEEGGSPRTDGLHACGHSCDKLGAKVPVWGETTDVGVFVLEVPRSDTLLRAQKVGVLQRGTRRLGWDICLRLSLGFAHSSRGPNPGHMSLGALS